MAAAAASHAVEVNRKGIYFSAPDGFKRSPDVKEWKDKLPPTCARGAQKGAWQAPAARTSPARASNEFREIL
jgi:hypothetical protein